MKNNKSFTLIELLVVIVIIGILASVIIISTSGSISKASVAKLKAFEAGIQNNLATNMVSAWDADHVDKNGTSWKLIDKWGNGNDGVFHNGDSVACSDEACPQVVADNAMGNVLSFDGVDDYVDYQNITSIDNSNFTISFWAKLNWPGGDSRVVIGKKQGLWGDETRGYEIIQASTSSMRMYIADGSKCYSVYLPVNQKKWEHYVFILSRTENKIKRYINGLPYGNNTEIVSNFGSIANNRIIRLMARPVGGYCDKGYLDDVKIYNAALSSAQIKQNYVAGLKSMLASGNISKQEYNQRIESLSSN